MNAARLTAAGAALRTACADLAAFAWPERCPVCGDPAHPARLLCEACLRAIPGVPYDLCPRCLVRGREPAGCRTHPAHVAHAAWLFDDAARAFIHALKFRGRPRLALAAGAALAGAVPPRHFDLVDAVPLHSLRRRVRGYNQAAALADVVSAACGIPRGAGLLERVRHTGPQVRLAGRGRRRNLAGAFRVRDPQQVRGRSVLIVDDVMTSGATMDAVLCALDDAGAAGRGLVLAWAQ